MKKQIREIYVKAELCVLAAFVLLSLLMYAFSYNAIHTQFENVYQNIFNSFDTYLISSENKIQDKNVIENFYYWKIKNYSYINNNYHIGFSGTIREASKENPEDYKTRSSYTIEPNNKHSFFYGKDTQYLQSITKTIDDANYLIEFEFTYNTAYEVLNSTYFIYLDLILLIVLHIGALYWSKTSENNIKAAAKLDEERKILTDAVAHELKTPLSVIKSNCECLRDNVNPEKNDAYFNAIEKSIDTMNEMLITFLKYTKMQSEDYILNFEENMLDEITEEVLTRYSTIINQKGITLEKKYENCFPVECDFSLIETAISNFISNAVCYTQDGNKIKISITGDKKGITFSVFNECDFIDEEEIHHFWTAFYKADKSRSANNNSTGMGLTLCKRILELHNAAYDCKYVDGGLVF